MRFADGYPPASGEGQWVPIDEYLFHKRIQGERPAAGPDAGWGSAP